MESNSEEKRKAFIKSLLDKQFARQVLNIEPIGKGNNNHVYCVSLDPSVSSDLPARPAKPGTIPLPTQTTEVIMRISNPDAKLNDAVRIENEVAAIFLAKNALSSYPSKIVPDVFGWDCDSSPVHQPESYSWIMEEFVTGEPLDKTFPSLSLMQKRSVLQQLANIFKKIQSYEVPTSITMYGGLGFNFKGEVTSGPLTIPLGGPFTTYEDIYVQNFVTQLKNADNNKLINGWKGDGGLRKRLENFHQSGAIVDLLGQLQNRRPTLVHGDLDLQNLLIDPTTLRITGLLDFDFSHIASSADEFFYSFPLIHGILTGPFENPEQESLRLAQLNGFSGVGETPPALGDSAIDWEVAKMWEEEMASAGVQRPSDIKGIEELAALYWFLMDICPPYFEMQRWLARRTPEQLEKAKVNAESGLKKYLERWGF
ncbi:kinase-like domain-containing protein [Lipomyces orientalis]|uniref:Kinase-like domain-containing protein n=1 Tax=Lipomyces orientalis TaxID=1233043 RepID=A0ACC3TI86_9ASCO